MMPNLNAAVSFTLLCLFVSSMTWLPACSQPSVSSDAADTLHVRELVARMSDAMLDMDEESYQQSREAIISAGIRYVPILIDIARTNDNIFDRLCAISAIHGIDDLPENLDAELLKIYKSEREGLVRLAALRVLLKIQNDISDRDDYMSVLIQALEDSEPLVRDEAVWSLGSLEAEAKPVIPRLISIMENTDTAPNQRHLIAMALPHIDNKSVIVREALERMLSDAYITSTAQESLRKMKSIECIGSP